MNVSQHALRRWRKESGLSLDVLAREIGTTKSWLSRIEAGEQASPALIRKLTARTGLMADAFMPVETAEAAE